MMETVKFKIETDAVTYAAYLKNDRGQIVHEIDKSRTGNDNIRLSAGIYEARLIIKGPQGRTATLSVTVGEKAQPDRKLKIRNPGSTEARGGRGFIVN